MLVALDFLLLDVLEYRYTTEMITIYWSRVFKTDMALTRRT
jgi:hypothetical protein